MTHDDLPQIPVVDDLKRTWTSQALCKDLPIELFFPVVGGNGAQGKKICRVCPVKQECLEWAIETSTMHGIFGGMSPKERMRYRSLSRVLAQESVAS